jgi:hypothetical protein
MAVLLVFALAFTGDFTVGENADGPGGIADFQDARPRQGRTRSPKWSHEKQSQGAGEHGKLKMPKETSARIGILAGDEFGGATDATTEIVATGGGRCCKPRCG